jgi:hypothetical protein
MAAATWRTTLNVPSRLIRRVRWMVSRFSSTSPVDGETRCPGLSGPKSAMPAQCTSPASSCSSVTRATADRTLSSSSTSTCREVLSADPDASGTRSKPNTV